jgi:hypothetical protein
LWQYNKEVNPAAITQDIDIDKQDGKQVMRCEDNRSKWLANPMVNSEAELKSQILRIRL